MSKRFKKLTAVFAVMFYIFSIMAGTAYAKVTDISGHKAAGVINKWISKGLAAAEAGGKFRPDEPIKKIEFISFINKVFNYTEKADIKLGDLIASSDYGKEAAKAIAAGYLKPDGSNKVYPFSPITHLDAVVMLSNVFGVSGGNVNSLSRFSDVDKIPLSNKDAVSAMVEKGYYIEYSGGKFSPWAGITRAEAVKLIDSIMDELVNKAGNYKGDCKGNVVVNTRNVTLKDTVIEGDLYLTEGIGDGDVKLENTIVKGKTFVRGGGRNSIVIRNSSLWGLVLVDKKDGNVRLVAEGSSSIYNVQLDSGAILEENGIKSTSGFDTVQVSSKITSGQDVRFDGDFRDIAIAASRINIQVDASVGKLQVRETAADTNIKMRSGNINEVNVQAPRSVLELTGGIITNLRINDEAKASKIRVEGAIIGTFDVKTNTSLDIARGTVEKLNIQMGSMGSYINIAKTANVTSLVNYAGVSIAGTTTQGPGALPYVYVGAQHMTIIEGSAAVPVVTVSPADSVLTFNTNDAAVAVYNPATGLIRGLKAGSAVFTITAARGGYNSSSTSFTVTVVPPNNNPTIAGSLTLAPYNANEATTQNITLTYTPGEELKSGMVEFNLPTGFMADTDDEISVAGGAPVKLKSEQISYYGYRVAVSGISTILGQSVVLNLRDVKIPSAGSHRFSAAADADGAGERAPSAGTGNEEKTFTSIGVSTTLTGTLAINPARAEAQSVQNIELGYKLGENFVNGTVTFTLPQEFKADGTKDIVTIGGTAAASVEISPDGQTVKVKGLNANKDTVVLLTLTGRIIPAPKSYDFKAIGDADGDGASRKPSMGTAYEQKIFVSATAAAPSVTAAVYATVDGSFDLTFTDNPSWRGRISAIRVGTETLTTGTYTVSEGKITLNPSGSQEMKKAGNKIITIVATDYADVTVAQEIMHGKAAKIIITGQPAAPETNGGLLKSQPVVKLADQYDNACTGDNNTDVTVAKDDSKDWMLGGTTTIKAVNGICKFTDLTASSPLKTEGVALKFSSTGIVQAVSTAQFNIPSPAIILTPADNATVDGNFTISCTDNERWRTGIYEVSVTDAVYKEGKILTVNAGYEVSGSSIIFKPGTDGTGILKISGIKTIRIKSNGFDDVTVVQNLSHGKAQQLTVYNQPLGPEATATILRKQPVIHLLDQYGNICTSDSTTEVTAQVGGSGVWTLDGNKVVKLSAGVAAFTNLEAERNTAVVGATIKFTVTVDGNIITKETNGFDIPGHMGNETAAIDSPVNNLYSNTDITTVTGKATSNNSDLKAVKVRIKDYDSGKYLNSSTSGLFTSDIPVDLPVSGTLTAWTVNLDSVIFSNGTYIIEAIANDGLDGVISTIRVIVDKKPPYRINIKEVVAANSITAKGYILLTTEDEPLGYLPGNTTHSWNSILEEIKLHTAISGGSWITGIDKTDLDIVPNSDGFSAKLVNKSSAAAHIVNDFTIPAGKVCDKAGNLSVADIVIDACNAPVIVKITVAEGGAIEAGLGAGDTLKIEFDVETNKTDLVLYANKSLVDEVINWGGKSFGSSYEGKWLNSKTLIITCLDATGATFAASDKITILSGADIRRKDGNSPPCVDISKSITGSF